MPRLRDACRERAYAHEFILDVAVGTKIIRDEGREPNAKLVAKARVMSEQWRRIDEELRRANDGSRPTTA